MIGNAETSMFELKVGIIKREANVIISNSTGGKEMQVNKVIYILLALFLGSFGIHKFYAGKNMQGILHLIFCWTGIPHILAIISAVITVFKPADEQGNVTL